MADNDKCEEKLKEMQQYLPYLEQVLQQSNVSENESEQSPRRQQHQKLQMLHVLLTKDGKRLKYDTLLKCESVLIKLYGKIEKVKPDNTTLNTNHKDTQHSTLRKNAPTTSANNNRPKDPLDDDDVIIVCPDSPDDVVEVVPDKIKDKPIIIPTERLSSDTSKKKSSTQKATINKPIPTLISTHSRHPRPQQDIRQLKDYYSNNPVNRNCNDNSNSKDKQKNQQQKNVDYDSDCQMYSPGQSWNDVGNKSSKASSSKTSSSKPSSSSSSSPSSSSSSSRNGARKDPTVPASSVPYNPEECWNEYAQHQKKKDKSIFSRLGSKVPSKDNTNNNNNNSNNSNNNNNSNSRITINIPANVVSPQSNIISPSSDNRNSKATSAFNSIEEIGVRRSGISAQSASFVKKSTEISTKSSGGNDIAPAENLEEVRKKLALLSRASPKPVEIPLERQTTQLPTNVSHLRGMPANTILASPPLRVPVSPASSTSSNASLSYLPTNRSNQGTVNVLPTLNPNDPRLRKITGNSNQHQGVGFNANRNSAPGNSPDDHVFSRQRISDPRLQSAQLTPPISDHRDLHRNAPSWPNHLPPNTNNTIGKNMHSIPSQLKNTENYRRAPSGGGGSFSTISETGRDIDYRFINPEPESFQRVAPVAQGQNERPPIGFARRKSRDDLLRPSDYDFESNNNQRLDSERRNGESHRVLPPRRKSLAAESNAWPRDRSERDAESSSSSTLYNKRPEERDSERERWNRNSENDRNHNAFNREFNRDKTTVGHSSESVGAEYRGFKSNTNNNDYDKNHSGASRNSYPMSSKDSAQSNNYDAANKNPSYHSYNKNGFQSNSKDSSRHMPQTVGKPRTTLTYGEYRRRKEAEEAERSAALEAKQGNTSINHNNMTSAIEKEKEFDPMHSIAPSSLNTQYRGNAFVEINKPVSMTNFKIPKKQTTTAPVATTITTATTTTHNDTKESEKNPNEKSTNQKSKEKETQKETEVSPSHTSSLRCKEADNKKNSKSSSKSTTKESSHEKSTTKSCDKDPNKRDGTNSFTAFKVNDPRLAKNNSKEKSAASTSTTSKVEKKTTETTTSTHVDDKTESNKKSDFEVNEIPPRSNGNDWEKPTDEPKTTSSITESTLELPPKPQRILRRRQTMFDIGSAPAVDKEKLKAANALVFEDLQDQNSKKKVARRSRCIVGGIAFEKTDDNCMVSTLNIIEGKRRTRTDANLNEQKQMQTLFKYYNNRASKAKTTSTSDKNSKQQETSEQPEHPQQQQQEKSKAKVKGEVVSSTKADISLVKQENAKAKAEQSKQQKAATKITIKKEKIDKSDTKTNNTSSGFESIQENVQKRIDELVEKLLDEDAEQKEIDEILSLLRPLLSASDFEVITEQREKIKRMKQKSNEAKNLESQQGKNSEDASLRRGRSATPKALLAQDGERNLARSLSTSSKRSDRSLSPASSSRSARSSLSAMAARRSFRKKNELERLQNDIDDMFIRDEVLAANGKRKPAKGAGKDATPAKGKEDTKLSAKKKAEKKSAGVKSKSKVGKLRKSTRNSSLGKKKQGRGKKTASDESSDEASDTSASESSTTEAESGSESAEEDTVKEPSGDHLSENEATSSIPMPKLKPIKPTSEVKIKSEVEKNSESKPKTIKRQLLNRPGPKSKKQALMSKKGELLNANNEDSDGDKTTSPDTECSNNQDMILKLKKEIYSDAEDDGSLLEVAINQAHLKNTNPKWHALSKYNKNCVLCKSKPHSLAMHYTQSHDGEHFTSRLCPIILSQMLANKKLSTPHIGYRDPSHSVYWLYTCPFCLKLKKGRKTLLLDHLTMHTGEFYHKCSRCGYPSNKVNVLDKHMQKCGPKAVRVPLNEIYCQKQQHSTIKAYVCHLCQYVRFNRYNLILHYEKQHNHKAKNASELGIEFDIFNIEYAEETNDEDEYKKLENDIIEQRESVEMIESDSDAENEIEKTIQKHNEEATSKVIDEIIEKETEVVDETQPKNGKTNKKDDETKHNETDKMTGTEKSAKIIKTKPQVVQASSQAVDKKSPTIETKVVEKKTKTTEIEAIIENEKQDKETNDDFSKETKKSPKKKTEKSASTEELMSEEDPLSTKKIPEENTTTAQTVSALALPTSKVVENKNMVPQTVTLLKGVVRLCLDDEDMNEVVLDTNYNTNQNNKPKSSNLLALAAELANISDVDVDSHESMECNKVITTPNINRVSQGAFTDSVTPNSPNKSITKDSTLSFSEAQSVSNDQTSINKGTSTDIEQLSSTKTTTQNKTNEESGEKKEDDIVCVAAADDEDDDDSWEDIEVIETAGKTSCKGGMSKKSKTSIWGPAKKGRRNFPIRTPTTPSPKKKEQSKPKEAELSSDDSPKSIKSAISSGSSAIITIQTPQITSNLNKESTDSSSVPVESNSGSLTFKPLIARLEDLSPGSPSIDTIETILDLVPQGSLQDLNDISSYLDNTQSVPMDIDTEISDIAVCIHTSADNNATSIHEALNFATEDTTHSLSSQYNGINENIDKSTVVGVGSDNTLKKSELHRIQNIGYCKKSDKTFIFRCLVPNCTFMFSDEFIGLETHCRDHSGVTWDGNCGTCKENYSLNQKELPLRAELKHLLQFHITPQTSKPKPKAVENLENVDSNASVPSPLNLAEETNSSSCSSVGKQMPRIKVRLLPGDCLSTVSPSYSSSSNDVPLRISNFQPDTYDHNSSSMGYNDNMGLAEMMKAAPKPMSFPAMNLSTKPSNPANTNITMSNPMPLQIARVESLSSPNSSLQLVNHRQNQQFPEQPMTLENIISCSDALDLGLRVTNVCSLNDACEVPPSSNVTTSSLNRSNNNIGAQWGQQLVQEKESLGIAALQSLETSHSLHNDKRTPVIAAATTADYRTANNESPGPLIVSETVPIGQATSGNFVITQTVSAQYDQSSNSNGGAQLGFNISIAPSFLASVSSSLPSATTSDTATKQAENRICTFFKCMANGCKFQSRIADAMKDHLVFHQSQNFSQLKDYLRCCYCDHVALDADKYINHCVSNHTNPRQVQKPNFTVRYKTTPTTTTSPKNDADQRVTSLNQKIRSLLNTTTATQSSTFQSTSTTTPQMTNKINVSQAPTTATAPNAVEVASQERQFLQQLEQSILEMTANTGLPETKLYRCVVKGCNINFPDGEPSFTTHVSFHASTTPGYKNNFPCPYCGAVFKTLPSIKTHIPNHMEHTIFCYLCLATSNPSHIIKHFNETHINSKKIKTFNILAKKRGNNTVQYYVANNTHLNEKEIQSFREKLVVEWQRRKAASRTHFKSNEIDLLPAQPIFSREIFCAECQYKSKVRTNMIRHLTLHKTNEIAISNQNVTPSSNVNSDHVPSAAFSMDPVNPVPCLINSEKHFDRMTNLSSSSLSTLLNSAGNSSNVTNSVEAATRKLPKLKYAYVAKERRYLCGIKTCNHLTSTEENFRAHLSALHAQVTKYICPFCNEEVCKRGMTVDRVIQHLRFHDKTLYRCEACGYGHYFKYVAERHINEKHLPSECSSLVIHNRSEENPIEGVVSMEPIYLRRLKGQGAGAVTNQQAKWNQQGGSPANDKTANSFSEDPKAASTTSTAKGKTTTKKTSQNPQKLSISDSLYMCVVCNAKSLTSANISAHCKTSHGTGYQYKCSKCDYGATTGFKILEHAKKEHTFYSESIVPQLMFRRMFEEGKSASNDNQSSVAEESAPPKPLWQRDDPNRIRHIRGILMEDEEESERHRKRLRLDDYNDDELEANTCNLFLGCYEFVCFYCSKDKASTATELKTQHWSMIHNQNPERAEPFLYRLQQRLKCPECQNFTGVSSEMRTHLVQEHSQYAVYAADVKRKKLLCGFCETTCTTARQLQIHSTCEQHEWHDVKGLSATNIGAVTHQEAGLEAATYAQCTLCNEIFANRYAVAAHGREKHANDDKPFSFVECFNETMYKCAECSYCSRGEVQLMRHQIDHYAKFQYCHFCSKPQESLNSYMQHCYSDHRAAIKNFSEIHPLNDIKKFLMKMYYIFPNGLIITKKDLQNTPFGKTDRIDAFYAEICKQVQQPPIPRLSVGSLMRKKSIEAQQHKLSGSKSPQSTSTAVAMQLASNNNSNGTPYQFPIANKIKKRRSTVAIGREEFSNPFNYFPVPPSSKKKKMHPSTLLPPPPPSSSSSPSRALPSASSISSAPSTSLSLLSSVPVAAVPKPSAGPEEQKEKALQPYSFYGQKPEDEDLTRLFTRVSLTKGVEIELSIDKFNELCNTNASLVLKKLTPTDVEKLSKDLKNQQQEDEQHTIPRQCKKACPASEKHKYM